MPFTQLSLMSTSYIIPVCVKKEVALGTMLLSKLYTLSGFHQFFMVPFVVVVRGSNLGLQCI